MALQQQGESQILLTCFRFNSVLISLTLQSKLVIVSVQFILDLLNQVGVPQMVMNGDTGQLALAHADANR